MSSAGGRGAGRAGPTRRPKPQQPYSSERFMQVLLIALIAPDPSGAPHGGEVPLRASVQCCRMRYSPPGVLSHWLGRRSVGRSPGPHLRRDWAHPSHICAGTGPKLPRPPEAFQSAYFRSAQANFQFVVPAELGGSHLCSVRRRRQSRCRCGRGVSPVPVQIWEGRAQSRRRCGSGEPSPGADVAEASPVLAELGGSHFC